jgi:signal transduction histidine kinase
MMALVGIRCSFVSRVRLVNHTVAAVRARVVGAWDDLRVDPSARLHPDLHLRSSLAAGRLLVLLRLAGVALVDVEVALTRRHAGPGALLIVLAVLANAGGIFWLFGRTRGVAVHAIALALMGFSGGLLASLQHGSAALALPAVAVAQVVADGSVLEALATGALVLVAVELGVVWANLSASAALGYPAIVLGAALVGLTRRQYVAQGRAAEALVAQTQRTEAIGRRAAALDERTRIAREIHDVLAHALGGLTVQLEAAEMLLVERGDVEGALERIRGSRRTAREGLEEARRAVAALRSDAPPLPETLTGLVESHREQGSGGELVVEGAARELPPEVSLTLMRTVQEALTNARRHSPGSAVRVRLVYEAARTSVTVTNDAAGRAPSAADAISTGGYGLTGMRERLELAGGCLIAGPSADGWTVTAEIPA